MIRIECQPASQCLDGLSSVASEEMGAGEVQIVRGLKRLDFDRVQTHGKTVLLATLAPGYGMPEIRVEESRQLAVVRLLVFEPAQVRQPVSPLALHAGANAEDERLSRICQQREVPVSLPFLSCRVCDQAPARLLRKPQSCEVSY